MEVKRMNFRAWFKHNQDVLERLWVALEQAYKAEYSRRRDVPSFIDRDKIAIIFANAVFLSISLSTRVPPMVAPDRIFFTANFEVNLYNCVLNDYIELYNTVSLDDARLFAHETVEVFDLISEKGKLKDFEIETAKGHGLLLSKKGYLEELIGFKSQERWISTIYDTKKGGRNAISLRILVVA